MNPIIVLAIALRTFVIPVVVSAFDGLDSLVLPILAGWIVLAFLLVLAFARIGLQRPKHIDA
jgi:hypothetical protein